MTTSADEIKIAIIVKRLTPAARCADLHAFAEGVREAQSRYGHDIADEGMRQTLVQFPDLRDQMIDFLPDEVKSHLHEAAHSIIAEVLENAGLRLEDHMRVTDRGVALTREAVKAIADTEFPQVAEFGEGNETLAGIGLDRGDGFIHPLSATMDGNSEYLNSWAVVSMTVSGALEWTDANQNKCLEFLQTCVSTVAPTVDLPTLTRRARYDDRALMKLCSYCQDGLQRLAEQTKR